MQEQTTGSSMTLRTAKARRQEILRELARLKKQIMKIETALAELAEASAPTENERLAA